MPSCVNGRMTRQGAWKYRATWPMRHFSFVRRLARDHSDKPWGTNISNNFRAVPLFGPTWTEKHMLRNISKLFFVTDQPYVFHKDRLTYLRKLSALEDDRIEITAPNKCIVLDLLHSLRNMDFPQASTQHKRPPSYILQSIRQHYLCHICICESIVAYRLRLFWHIYRTT